jgi:quinoprotein glucose dehydrogenase
MFRGLKIILVGITLMGASLAPLGLTQQTRPKAPVKTAAGTAKEVDPDTSGMKVPPGDWPMYGRDLTSSRYSPLSQINRENVSKLATAWSYRPSPQPGDDEKGGETGRGRGAAPGVVTEATPIVVNGIMYLPAGNLVVALDAGTGKEIWSHRTVGGRVQTRAVGYWPGDRTNPARILYTVGTKMFALNAATGNIDPGFGKEGVVDIEITWGGAPYVYKNLIIMGNNNGERSDGPAGNTKVYDARNGAELWRFKTMVQPDDKNYPGSWLDHSDQHSRAGLNVWGWYFTVDEQRDLLYMPVGGPAGNYYGGDRPR